MRRLKPWKGALAFTLIELVVTILLLAIISVVVLPRFFGASSYSAFALRQEIIAELRRDQLLAFNNSDRCFRLNVTDSGYQLLHLTQDCSAEIFQESLQEWPRGAQLQLDGRNQFSILFDTLGRPQLSCTESCLQAVADDVLPIVVEPEGYIHEG